jgi:NAD(P)-dependent dehydrogenase (short-subunit alcohol dehydrogenase family)
VITGGGSGIGQAIALKFAAQGAVIRVLDVNESAAVTTCQRISSAGGTASAQLCDVTNQHGVNAWFEELFHRDRVHILINSAGISHIGTVESTSEEDFDRVLRVNVKGSYNSIRAVVGHMKNSGGGVIVNLASIAGSAGLADRFAYSTSKGAIVAMTYSVARDYLAHNIRCNCISGKPEADVPQHDAAKTRSATVPMLRQTINRRFPCFSVSSPRLPISLSNLLSGAFRMSVLSVSTTIL